MNNWRSDSPSLRVWPTIVAALLTVALLTACQPADPPVEEATVIEPTAAPVEEAPTAEPAVEEAAPESTMAPAEENAAPQPPPTLGVVSVGINPAFQPFVFKDENGQLTGFDVDLVNALSAVGNFEVGYTRTSFGGLFSGLTSGAFDIAVGAITVTDDRKQIVDFTDPYYRSGQSPVTYYDAGQGIAVAVENSTILGPNDLTDTVRVGVKAGTTGERFVVDQTTGQFVRYPEAPDALDALAAGEVDAVVVDIPVITNYVRNNPNAGVKLTGGPVTVEEYAIAVTKSKPELRDGLNAALNQLREDGTYDAIFQKWFGSP